jgi:hypothetical protein
VTACARIFRCRRPGGLMSRLSLGTRTLDNVRSRNLLIVLLLATTVIAGCVSRNVENIGEEEAASMAPPPAPLSAEERASAVIDEPGFTGLIEVDPAAGSVPEGVLYVIVRVAGRETGAPLAVKRLSAELPAEFTVTSADSMIPGTPLVDAMDVTVRLDQDGDAWSQQPGDLSGFAGGVAVGDTLQIVLTPEDATAQ